MCDGEADCFSQEDESSLLCTAGTYTMFLVFTVVCLDCQRRPSLETSTFTQPFSSECDRYQCGSGECIDEDWICDGINDCVDRGDEKGTT